MKIKNTLMITHLIGTNQKKYSEFKKLILSEKSESFSKNIKLNIDTTTSDTLIKTLSDVVNLLPERKYLLFFPNIENNVIEIEKSNNILSIFYHIGYGVDIYTFEWKFKVGEGWTEVPKFNKSIPLPLRMLLDNFFKGEFKENIKGITPSIEQLFSTVLIIPRVLPMIVFIDLSKDNVKLSYIEPKGKIGTFSKNDILKNETKIGAYRVDSLWNVNTIGIGEFKVSGHFRLQRCGVGYSEVKLIFIEDFVKTHYIRRSTRDIVFDEVPTKEKELV
jgi:hypothetical protein